MAIYHLSAKIVSRKAGRSATGAAAYRSAERVVDQRTGEVHDYTRKQGVEHSEVVMPSSTDWRPSRAELWNAVEEKNKRADAQVAREFEVALPAELTAEQRRELAVAFAREIADRYKVAADVAVHAPNKQGDERNHHAHILTTTNRIDGQGLGNKARELDLVAHNMGGKVGQANEVDNLRECWADHCNRALERAGHEARVDHRSLKEQGVDREPTQHMGVAATAIERRGEVSELRQRMEAGLRHRQEQQAKRERQAVAPELHGAAGRFKGKLAEHRAEKAAELERQRLAKIEAEQKWQAEAKAKAEREHAAKQAGYKQEVQTVLAKLSNRPDWKQAEPNKDGHLGSIGKGYDKVDIYGDSQGRAIVAFNQYDRQVDQKGDPAIVEKLSQHVERTLERSNDYGMSM